MALLLIVGSLIVGVWCYFKLKGRRIARTYSCLMIVKNDLVQQQI